MRHCLLLLLISLWSCLTAAAQVDLTRDNPPVAIAAGDSIDRTATDPTVQSVLQKADSIVVPEVKLSVDKAFRPNPTKAVLLGLVPGLGQIYNRKYWKLPIVYGGLMGCMYAITWNNRNYQDYSVAYKDIVYDATVNPDKPDAWSQTWQVLTSMDPADAIKDSNFKDRIKRQKDYFRRYRDLSIIITAGVYALTLIDAYVDAQLFNFDISPDLSMRVEPVVTPKTSVTPRSYGLNCSLKF